MDPTFMEQLRRMMGMGTAASAPVPTDPVDMMSYMTPGEQANLAATTGAASPMANAQPSAQENLFSALSNVKAPEQPEAIRPSAPGQYQAPGAQDPSRLLAYVLGREATPDRRGAQLSTLLGR
jgi:hypothetical protein